MKLIPPAQSILGTFALGYIYWGSVLNFLGEDMTDIMYHQLMRKGLNITFQWVKLFLCGIRNWMTGWPRICWCLKAVILEAVWSCQMQTSYEYCIFSLLLPNYFQWLLLLTKKYLFYTAFESEPGKKKKYCNWLLLSVKKTGIIIMTSKSF